MRYPKAAHVLAVACVLVLPAALIVPFLWAMKTAGVDLFAQNHTGLTGSAIYLAFLAVLAPAILFVQRFPGADFSFVGKAFNLKTTAVGLAFVLVAMFGGGALRSAFSGEEESALRALGGQMAAIGSMEFVLTFIMVGLLAPIVEELVFRQYLFTLLPYRKSMVWSIAVAALWAIVFSAVHTQYANPITFGVIAVLAFGFGMARVITGGILLPILMHALVNNMSLLSMTLSPVNAG